MTEEEHEWPFYLRISQHAFQRAHQRIPTFTNVKALLNMIMPNVDVDKFEQAPFGVNKISTPEFIYLINKTTEDSALLITVVIRAKQTIKNRRDYLEINEVGRCLLQQIAERKLL